MNNSKFEQYEWLSPSSHFSLVKNLSHQQVYIHYPSKSLVQAVTTKIFLHQYQIAKDIAEWRYKTQYPIIKVYYGELKKEVRQGVYVNIFIEKIQRTLEELKGISLLQSLYILKTALIAIERLTQKFGFFHLTNKMIGLNTNNQCKVWINESFQKFTIQRKVLNQQTNIKDLSNIVQSITETTNQSLQFFLRAKQQSLTFIRAQNFIFLYIYEHQMIIPPLYLDSSKKYQSFQNQKPIKNQKLTTEYHSYISQQANNKNYLFNTMEISRTQKKITNLFSSNFAAKNSPKISFSYNNRIHNYKKPQISNNAIMKESKHTMANSSQNAEKTNNKYLANILKNSKKSSISLTNNISVKNLLEERREMKIMSTISLMIENQNKDKVKRDQRKKKEQQKQQYQEQIMKKIIDEGLQKNCWKKKISQLFSSDKNLKKSMSYGEEEKSYLKDINLKKLGQFGRYIKTSLLQKDEEEQSQFISAFSTIIQE